MTSLTDTAHRAASQDHRTSRTSTSHVSFPSGDCFLILLGHSKWQHLDLKVDVKGSFVFKNGTKDKQQMLGSPEITFWTVAYVSVSKLQIWLDPDWNTYHATNNSKRRPYFMNQQSCPTTCPVWASFTWSPQNCTTLFTNIWEWQKGTGAVLPDPIIIILVLRYVPALNIQVSMILKVSLFYNLGQIIFENWDRMGAC